MDPVVKIAQLRLRLTNLMHFIFGNCLVGAPVNCHIINPVLVLVTLATRQVFFWLCMCAPAHMCFSLIIYMHVCVFYTNMSTICSLSYILSLLSLNVFIDSWMDNTKETQYLVLLCCHLLLTQKWDAPPLRFLTSLYNITDSYVFNWFDDVLIYEIFF